jgi:putative transposase
MPRPLSLDLRARIVEAVENGASRHSVAARFAVAVSSVVKLVQAHKATGSLAPKPMGGYRKHILEPHAATVAELVGATPDATLDELRDALKKRRITASRSSVNRFVKKMKLSFKKKDAPRERTGPGRRGGGARRTPGGPAAA